MIDDKSKHRPAGIWNESFSLNASITWSMVRSFVSSNGTTSSRLPICSVADSLKSATASIALAGDFGSETNTSRLRLIIGAGALVRTICSGQIDDIAACSCCWHRYRKATADFRLSFLMSRSHCVFGGQTGVANSSLTSIFRFFVGVLGDFGGLLTTGLRTALVVFWAGETESSAGVCEHIVYAI